MFVDHYKDRSLYGKLEDRLDEALTGFAFAISAIYVLSTYILKFMKIGLIKCKSFIQQTNPVMVMLGAFTIVYLLVF